MPRTVLTRQNDTIDLICDRALGRTAGVTEEVLATNPGIAAREALLPAGLPVTIPDRAPPVTAPALVSLWD